MTSMSIENFESKKHGDYGMHTCSKTLLRCDIPICTTREVLDSGVR